MVSFSWCIFLTSGALACNCCFRSYWQAIISSCCLLVTLYLSIILFSFLPMLAYWLPLVFSPMMRDVFCICAYFFCFWSLCFHGGILDLPAFLFAPSFDGTILEVIRAAPVYCNWFIFVRSGLSGINSLISTFIMFTCFLSVLSTFSLGCLALSCHRYTLDLLKKFWEFLFQFYAIQLIVNFLLYFVFLQLLILLVDRQALFVVYLGQLHEVFVVLLLNLDLISSVSDWFSSTCCLTDFIIEFGSVICQSLVLLLLLLFFCLWFSGFCFLPCFCQV